jgi:hypothetical protein
MRLRILMTFTKVICVVCFNISILLIIWNVQYTVQS